MNPEQVARDKQHAEREAREFETAKRINAAIRAATGRTTRGDEDLEAAHRIFVSRRLVRHVTHILARQSGAEPADKTDPNRIPKVKGGAI